MKKITLLKLLSIITFVGIIQINSNAQDIIVQWTFPTESAEADGGAIEGNLTKVIETAGGTSNIQFKNGLTTKAAQATGWDNGKDGKSWNVEFETTGFTNIKLSSIITSGGNDPGPRDFKVQYSLENGEWTDVSGSQFQTANDWTTGALVDLLIPNVCDDQANIKIRWIMISDTATDGSIVASSGKSKIDNIIITGDLINDNDELYSEYSISVYPNPATDYIIVKSESKLQVELYDINGKRVSDKRYGTDDKIDISKLNSGIYVLKIEKLKDKSVVMKKVLIQ